MTYHIATVGDYGYLTRILLLYESLRKHEPEARFHLLAMDDRSLNTARAINDPNLLVYSLAELETPELTAARKGRNWIEWVWLFQPALPLFLLEQGVPHVFWMDGDMWLWDSLDEMFDEIGDADVAVSPHRFPPQRAGGAQSVSIYNGGATYFRNTERGVACCKKWLADCIEWDYWWSADKPGPKRGQKGGTQGYLDFWPEEWGACVVEHLGCNLAPWNQDDPSYEYEIDDDGKITISGQKLIFYHYQDFRWERGMLAGPPLVPFVREHIYSPYIEAYELKSRLWQPKEVAKDPNKMA